MAASPREIAYLLSIGKLKEKTAQFLEFPKEASTRTDSVQPSWPASTHAEAGGTGVGCVWDQHQEPVRPVMDIEKLLFGVALPAERMSVKQSPLGHGVYKQCILSLWVLL